MTILNPAVLRELCLEQLTDLVERALEGDVHAWQVLSRSLDADLGIQLARRVQAQRDKETRK